MAGVFNPDTVAKQLLRLISCSDSEIISFLTEQFRLYQDIPSVSCASASSVSSHPSFQGRYVVTVSAHGLDQVSCEKLDSKVSVTFMLQQPEHSFSAFACSHPISGSTSSYCDFRTRVSKCMSSIMFSLDDQANGMFQRFKQELFKGLYATELQAHGAEVDETKYGRAGRSETAFELASYPLRHDEKQICRKYDLAPNPISYTDVNQLEYTDSSKTQVWLAPGISVSADLIDMCSGHFGLEINMITSGYGVFVDVHIPGHASRIGVDIFELLQELTGVRSMNQKKSDISSYKKYEDANKKPNQKFTSRLGEYGIPGLTVNPELTQSELLNSVLRQLEIGDAITSGVDPSMVVASFLSKYYGNLHSCLDKSQITDILALNAANVLGVEGEKWLGTIGVKYKTALQLSKFIRKVFILHEFSHFIRPPPPFSITSDEIIAILVEYHKHKQKSDGAIKIDFLDQTCRDCNIKRCRCRCTHSDSKKGGNKKKQKTKKNNKGRNIHRVKRNTKARFRSARNRKYRNKLFFM